MKSNLSPRNKLLRKLDVRGLAGIIRIRIERRDQAKAKQWSKYLQCAENKEELVRFLLDDWNDKNRFLELLRNKTLYVNVGPKFFKVTTSTEPVEVRFVQSMSLQLLYCFKEKFMIGYVQVKVLRVLDEGKARE